MDFIAVVDVIMNDTSWYADVVLPESSYLERYDPLHVVGDEVFIRQPVIEPQGNTRSALWIYKELGKRLGLDDFFQYEDEKDYLRQQLAPINGSLDTSQLPGYSNQKLTREMGKRSFSIHLLAKLKYIQKLWSGLDFHPGPPGKIPHSPQRASCICCPEKLASILSPPHKTINSCINMKTNPGLVAHLSRCRTRHKDR